MTNDLPFLVQSEMDDLVSILGGPIPWNDLDETTATVLYRFFDPDDLRTIAVWVMESTGKRPVVPTDLMNLVAKTILEDLGTSNHSARYARSSATVDLSALRLDLDPDAMNMLVRGSSEQAVSIFHKMAPEGYWEDVSVYMEETLSTGETLLDAYDALEDKYEWHPMNRRVAA